jgi:hypothetical protein
MDAIPFFQQAQNGILRYMKKSPDEAGMRQAKYGTIRYFSFAINGLT